MNTTLKLAGLAAILLTTNAYAQENSSQRRATDPVLFPEAGSFIVEAKLTSTVVEYTWEYIGREYLDGKIETTGASYSALYAFNDFFGLGLSIDQAFSSKAKATYGVASSQNGVSEETKSSGFDDPEVSFVYRAMDMSRDSFDLNLFVSASPSLIDAETATTTADGNNAKGGDTYDFGVKWGGRREGFAWAAGLTIAYSGEAESKTVATGEKTTVTSHTDFALSLEAKWDVSERVRLGVLLGLGGLGGYDVKYSSGTTNSYDSTSFVTIGGTADFLLVDELYLNLELAGTGVSDREVTSGATVIDDTERSAGQFSVGLIAQF